MGVRRSIAFAFLSAATWVGALQVPSGVADYERDVAPIFKASCVGCHGSSNLAGGLDLSSSQGLRKGGVSGAALVTGKSGQSLIFQRLMGHGGMSRMPPGKPLPQAQLDKVRAWIDQGARLPGKTSFAADVAPILKAHCLSCHSGSSPSAGLDLSNQGSLLRVVQAGNVERSKLWRRIEGLDDKPRMPMGFAPLSKEQRATIADWIREGARFDAQAKAHWSYVAPKVPPVPAVRSKNWPRNPIDHFVLSKLEKQGWSPSPPASPEILLRRVTLDLTGLPPTPEDTDRFLSGAETYEQVVERLLASPHYGEHQARMWLDLARYADTHGFEKDPSRSAWLYRDWLIGAFNRNLPFDRFTIEQLAGDMLPNASRDQLVATGFHRNTMHNLEGGVDQEEAHHYVVVDRVNTTATVWLGSTMSCARCHDHKFDPTSQKDYTAMLAIFGNTEIKKTGDARVSEEKWGEPNMRVATPAQLALERSLLDRRAHLAARNDQEAIKKLDTDLRQLRTQIPTAMILKEKPSKAPLQAPLLERGEWLGKKGTVEAGTPHFLPPLREKANRLSLARWLVNRTNPLTARVQVNRMWESHFGRGIVETSEDFGTQGSKPSHPELLDWLAVRFMESGWDMKAMHRLIVTSATYRQSSDLTPKLKESDPQNVLLARGPRGRLDAEAIRDNALAVAGLLNRKVGGPSVMPYQPDGIWNSPYSGERWVNAQGEDRYRRGMYTFIKRTAPYPAFTTFDAGSREECTVRRPKTNTPLQALALLNDPVMLEAAAALAKRIAEKGLDYGFRASTGRRPSPAESARLKLLREGLIAKHGKTPDESLQIVALTLLNLDETITKR